MKWFVLFPQASVAGVVDAPVLALGGHKECGAAVTDFDRDGDLDLIAPGNSGEVRVLQNEGSLTAWSDLTEVLAPELLEGGVARGLLAADLTHDGWPDLVRVSTDRADIFVHDGESLGWTRQYSFPSAFSFEGSALLDVDADGWLDVLVTDGYAANWVLFNPADGSAAFDAVDQGQLGVVSLRPSATNSDFVTVGDWDVDGDPDVVIRGEGLGTDAFRRIPNGWDPWNDLHLDALDSQKGGVALCDVRGVGSLDLFWTSPVEPAFRQFAWGDEWDPLEPGDLGVTGATSVACGDMDNDSIVDVLLSDDDDDELFFGPDLLKDPLDDDERNTIALTVADLDRDGDLDLYQVNDNEQSSLFENDFADTPALSISPRVEVSSCPKEIVTREAIGAQLRLRTPEGEWLGSLQELSGGFGRGQSSSPELLFAGAQPGDRLVVSLMFPGQPAPVEAEFLPTSREVVITQRDPDGDGLRQESTTDDFDLDGFVDALDADTDGDGYSDTEEAQLTEPCGLPLDFDGDGTPDHLDLDSDNDGLPDERDPGRIDLDSDGDGLLDADEQARGTDPGFADTDEGGRTDGQEVLLDNTDPLDPSDDVADSDRDGLSDAEEVELGTDPGDPDTDGDGVLDGADPLPLDAGSLNLALPKPPYGCGCALSAGTFSSGGSWLLLLGLAVRRARARR